MILLAKPNSPATRDDLKHELEAQGFTPLELSTAEGPLFSVLNFNAMLLERLPARTGTYTLFEPREPYILSGLTLKNTPTEIGLSAEAGIGNGLFCVMAGPCSIESEEQILTAARVVKENGAGVLRGGAFKPRTSPYSFQGLGEKGLQWLRKAGDATGLPIVTEVLDQDDIGIITEYADIIQVGARNCQNYALLKKLSKATKPVLLKRGMMVTIEELLFCAEYLLSGGNMNVILCERGIRTFETGTRNTLDISAVPLLKQKTHLPVIIDPSHAGGSWKLVEPLALAGAAVGADGLMIEVHPTPETALCDGEQSLRPERFASLMVTLKKMTSIVGKRM